MQKCGQRKGKTQSGEYFSITLFNYKIEGKWLYANTGGAKRYSFLKLQFQPLLKDRRRRRRKRQLSLIIIILIALAFVGAIGLGCFYLNKIKWFKEGSGEGGSENNAWRETNLNMSTNFLWWLELAFGIRKWKLMRRIDFNFFGVILLLL